MNDAHQPHGFESSFLDFKTKNKKHTYCNHRQRWTGTTKAASCDDAKHKQYGAKYLSMKKD